MQLQPCSPCCATDKAFCHPRICYRFVDAWSGDPINVQVLQPGGCHGWSVTGSGSDWCFDMASIDASGNCAQTLRQIPVDTSGNLLPTGTAPGSSYSMCQGLFTSVVWDMGDGHTCAGLVTAPAGVCCASGDPTLPFITFPLCCPKLCMTVNTPPIPGDPSWGVGTSAALVSDVAGPDMLLLPQGAQTLPFQRVDGPSTTTWQFDCGPSPTLTTGKNSSGYDTYPQFNTQRDIKMVVNPVTNYQAWGTCGDETHRIWGDCKSFRYQPCRYNELAMDMTEHPGTVVPWCLSGPVQTCTEVPVTPYQNQDGLALASASYANVPRLSVNIVNPPVASHCGGFGGGVINFIDCASYRSGGGFTWRGCVGYNGPQFKVETCYPQVGTVDCPQCKDCFDRTLPVKSVDLSVTCTTSGLSASWIYYFSDSCATCIQCTGGGGKICSDDPNWAAASARPIGFCSGNLGKTCFSWVGWESGGYYLYGRADGGTCPGCPDCCFEWWDNGGGCFPACDSSVTCEKCDSGTMDGPKVISYEPLLVEFRGCHLVAGPPFVVCGALQGTLTSA